MSKPSATELAVVTAVGFGLAFAARKTGITEKAPLTIPALLYTLGFYIATRRPEKGYAQLS